MYLALQDDRVAPYAQRTVLLLPWKENGAIASTPVATANRLSFVEKTESKRFAVRLEIRAHKLKRKA